MKTMDPRDISINYDEEDSDEDNEEDKMIK